MANKIQIKRSTTNSAPTGLANGELAYTANGGVLFIGSANSSNNDTVVYAIGGIRNPGVLTANQALVANSSKGIDNVIVANLTPTQIYANGAVGSAGQILTSGAAGNVYWGAAPSGVTDLTDTANATTVTIESSTGTDAILESANATAAGILTSADWTKLNNMPANSVAGSTTQVMFNNAGVLAGDAGFTFVTATDALTLGGAALTTAPIFSVANTSGSANLTSATLTIGTSSVNSTAVASGANVYLTTTTLFAGNSTINASHTSSLVQVSNSTSTANLTAAALLVASNSTVNATHSATLLQVANSTSTANVTAAGLTIGNTVANTTGLFVGANVFANATAFDVGNTVITTTNLTLGGQVTANGSAGTANNVLVSGGAGNAYWTNSLSLTDITLSGNLTINGTLTTVDTTNLVVKDPLIKLANGNVTTDTLDIGFFGVYDSSGSQDRFAGIFRDASDGTFKVFANTTVEPTTTVDIAGVGYTTGTIQSFLTTGNTTFGTTSPFFVANATSVSINSDRLIANSTALNITANATVSVALTANSLSLTTALPATSGGTGTGTYTSGDLLVANTGNTLSKLSLGTDGKVLQSNGTAVIYADLDGGTF